MAERPKDRYLKLSDAEIVALIRAKADQVVSISSSKAWWSLEKEARSILEEIGDLFAAKAAINKNSVRG